MTTTYLVSNFNDYFIDEYAFHDIKSFFFNLTVVT